jgi:sugar phosphate permease
MHSILFFLQLMHITFPNKLLFYVLICRTFIGSVRIGINSWHILIKNKMWTIVDSCHVVFEHTRNANSFEKYIALL